MSRNYSIDSLREVAGGDEEFMAIVAQTFLDEIPPDLASLVSELFVIVDDRFFQ